jgi:hypothetical protein
MSSQAKAAISQINADLHFPLQNSFVRILVNRIPNSKQLGLRSFRRSIKSGNPKPAIA